MLDTRKKSLTTAIPTFLKYKKKQGYKETDSMDKKDVIVFFVFILYKPRQYTE